MTSMPTTAQAFAAYFDHTLLKPTATPSEIAQVCAEAREFSFAAVCVNGVYLARVARALAGSTALPIAVVGFPLGAMTTRDKAMETRHLVEDGAREIDMVLSLGAFLSGERGQAGDDIHAVVGAAGKVPVKVIIETAFLTSDQIADATILCAETNAAFVKTSTGFGPRGASKEDIATMAATITRLGVKGNGLKIKASGGIRTLEAARIMIEAGAHRIGSSNSVQMVKEFSVSLP